MSSKIILNLAVSLDGFIADEQGGYDWIKPSGNTVQMFSIKSTVCNQLILSFDMPLSVRDMPL